MSKDYGLELVVRKAKSAVMHISAPQNSKIIFLHAIDEVANIFKAHVGLIHAVKNTKNLSPRDANERLSRLVDHGTKALQSAKSRSILDEQVRVASSSLQRAQGDIKAVNRPSGTDTERIVRLTERVAQLNSLADLYLEVLRSAERSLRGFIAGYESNFDRSRTDNAA